MYVYKKQKDPKRKCQQIKTRQEKRVSQIDRWPANNPKQANKNTSAVRSHKECAVVTMSIPSLLPGSISTLQERNFSEIE